MKRRTDEMPARRSLDEPLGTLACRPQVGLPLVLGLPNHAAMLTSTVLVLQASGDATIAFTLNSRYVLRADGHVLGPFPHEEAAEAVPAGRA